MLDNRITEAGSNYENLEHMPLFDLLTAMNQEDQTVPSAVAKQIPAITAFVEALLPRMLAGGRLIYFGAGTSGRLGIVDASECPPTFGVPPNLVQGIIAGGDAAIRKAVEFAEDNNNQAWLDLQALGIQKIDTVIGITASGTTPYVLGGIEACKEAGLLTAGICCNPNSPLANRVHHAIVPIVGPEFITGSTRLKAGTAQKLVLNMISTSCMIKMGRVKGNQMVDMQLSNNKLINRGVKMIMQATNLSYPDAEALLQACGSVRLAIQKFQS